MTVCKNPTNYLQQFVLGRQEATNCGSPNCKQDSDNAKYCAYLFWVYFFSINMSLFMHTNFSEFVSLKSLKAEKMSGKICLLSPSAGSKPVQPHFSTVGHWITEYCWGFGALPTHTCDTRHQRQTLIFVTCIDRINDLNDLAFKTRRGYYLFIAINIPKLSSVANMSELI